MKCYQFRGRWWSLLSGLVLLGMGTSIRAQDGCSEGVWLPWWKRLFIKRDRGELYYGRGGPPHTFDQTGHPDQISRFAYPSETPNYFGYYAGGGCTFHGGPPGPADGTWGWDYSGLCVHCKRLVLNWCQRCKGGAFGGPYRIDGPKTPDVGPYIEKLKEGPGHKSEHEEEEHGGGHEVEHHSEPLKGHNGDGH